MAKARKFGPLVLPKFKLDGTAFDWKDRVIDTERFDQLPLVWTKAGLEAKDSEIRFASTIATGNKSTLLRVPRVLLVSSNLEIGDFDSVYKEFFEKNGIIYATIPTQVPDPNPGGLAPMGLPCSETEWLDPEKYVGGELLILNIIGSFGYTESGECIEDFISGPIPTDIIEMIDINGDRTPHDGGTVSIDPGIEYTCIDSHAVEIPGKADADVELLKKAVKSFGKLQIHLVKPEPLPPEGENDPAYWYEPTHGEGAINFLGQYFFDRVTASTPHPLHPTARADEAAIQSAALTSKVPEVIYHNGHPNYSQIIKAFFGMEE